MKKLLSLVFTSVLLLSCFGVQALASTERVKPEQPGVYSVESIGSASLSVSEISAVSGSFTDGDLEFDTFYPRADTFSLNYTLDSGYLYNVMILNRSISTQQETDSLSENDIYYIDQYKATVNGNHTFVLSPKSMTAGQYFVYLTSNVPDFLNPLQVGSFWYFSGGVIAEPVGAISSSYKVNLSGINYEILTADYSIKVTSPSNGWIAGSADPIEFYIENTDDVPCVVLKKSPDGVNNFKYELISSVGSGTVHKYAVKMEEKDQILIALKGDIDFSGTLLSSDALFVLRAGVGNITPNEIEEHLVDIDRNNDVNSADALLVLRASVGYPVLSW